MTTLPLIIIGVLTSSIFSALGMLLFSIRKGLIERSMLFLISFSTGALLGDVFLHMLPEMIEESSIGGVSWYYILVGILASFVLEKLIHWRHCHVVPSAEHHHPVGTMNLVGDALHNITDGMLIAGSFLADTRLGIATTIAVILHEVPQEIGDFAILVYSGFTKKKALFFNILTTLSALIGAIFVFGFSATIPNLESYLVPITAGNFLYIAGSDLIPELHKETAAKKSILQLLFMLGGIALMAALTFIE